MDYFLKTATLEAIPGRLPKGFLGKVSECICSDNSNGIHRRFYEKISEDFFFRNL